MKKKLKYSNKFKKDLKKYRNQPDKLEKLFAVLELLENSEDIPQKSKPHKLKGEYSDCLECHIENDFLLIWIDEKKESHITLVRLGSHSELFG